MEEESRTKQLTVNENEELLENESAQSIVTICYSNQRFGIACYNEMENIIYADTFHLPTDEISNVLFSLKMSCCPSLFLLHPQVAANKELVDLITLGTDGITPNFYRFKVIKSSHWNEKTAIATICRCLVIRTDSMRTSNTNETAGHFTGTYQRLESCLDMDSQPLRQCLGALVLYMQDSVFHLDDGKISISNVKPLPMTSYVQMDWLSFQSLQVFSEERHPNVIKGTGRSKEGFSLYGLFDRTLSLPGRKKLRDWMAKPFYDKKKIIHRQNGIAWVVRPTNQDLISTICSIMKHIHDIPKVLLRIKKVEAKCNEWCRLHSSLQHGLRIIEQILGYASDEVIRPHPDDLDFVQEWCEGLNTRSLYQIFRHLDDVLDVPLSLATAELTLRTGFDVTLDGLRATYDYLESKLIETAHKILDLVPLLQNLAVEYIPQLGYLVAVQKSLTHFLQVEADGNSDFEFIFAQEEVHYFKHPLVCEMDDTIGDVKSLIGDRQKVLILQLEDTLLDGESELQHLALLLASLDAIISLGTLTKEGNLCRPDIVEEAVVVIKNGRHLLQALSVDNFVTNDTFLNEEKNIGLISGSNGSGKSVYLKQVGLIVYLAHIGCYVPCDRAVIGITDRIMTRIQSVESVSTPQSSFTLDLTQIGKILANHSERSLCLIDEFGKGTTPVDGVSLLAAVIHHFAVHGGKVLFALHFTELLQNSILGQFPEVMNRLNCFRMETYQPIPDPDAEADPFSSAKKKRGRSDALSPGVIASDLNPPSMSRSYGEDYHDVIPLYKLKLGVAPSSEGIPCARHVGLSDEIVQRSVIIQQSVVQGTVIPSTSSQQKRIQTLVSSTDRELVIHFLSTPSWHHNNNIHPPRHQLDDGPSVGGSHSIQAFRRYL